MSASRRFVCLALAALFAAGVVRAADERKTIVGMPAKIENLVLPGTELEVKPLDDRRATVVVRITKVEKHGTAHRYDMTYYCLEAGKFDLRDFVKRIDGSAVSELPPIVVVSESVLPPGHIIPNQPTPEKMPFLGGYKWATFIAGVIWILGFAAILLVKRKKRQDSATGQLHKQSLADRLRPLVESGLAGQLSLEQRAELERSLLAFWTKRLRLGALKPAQKFERLRADADAGPLLLQLEAWLHKPGPQSAVDVSALLKPYRNLPADALDSPVEVAAK